MPLAAAGVMQRNPLLVVAVSHICSQEVIIINWLAGCKLVELFLAVHYLIAPGGTWHRKPSRVQ